MPRIVMRLCYFCYEDGEYVEATHSYCPKGSFFEYDVCDAHADRVKEAGLQIWDIDPEDLVREY